MKDTLIIFARNPIKGRVKTRLAKHIGADLALDIYHQLLAHTRNVAEKVDCRRMLFYDMFIDWEDGWPNDQFEKHLQEGDTLGEKLLNAMKQVYEEKTSGRIVIIGSDTPYIETTHIESAFSNLRTRDFILGPANDGGYYLLGMASFHPNVVCSKPWSSDELLDETIKEIRNLGRSYGLLNMLNDIDTYEDLALWKPKKYDWCKPVG